MEVSDKQIKVTIHETLNNNGFYRLPLHKLTQILLLLQMPLVKQAKLIQQHTIQGLIKLTKKIEGSKNKSKEYFNEEISQQVSLQIKSYLSIIVEELLQSNRSKNTKIPSKNIFSANPLQQVPQKKMLKQQLKDEYNWEQDAEAKNQNNYKPFEDEVNKKRQENELQLLQNLSRDSEYYHNHSSKFIKPQTNEIEIQTDLTLLYQQIQIFPRPKVRKIRKSRIKRQKMPRERRSIKKKISKAQSIKGQKQANQTVKQDKNYFVTLNQNNLYDEQQINHFFELRKRQSQFQRIKMRVNQSLKNVVKQRNLFKNCVCLGEVVIEQSFECLTCKNKFHYSCLKYELSQKIYECPLCKLLLIDPISEVKDTVGTYFVKDIQDNKFQTTASFGQYEYFLSKRLRTHEIEFRCLRLGDSLQSIEIVWPDQIWITINNKLAFQIQGLALNSSLKRRKDIALPATSHIFHDGEQLNNVKIGMQVRPLTNQDLTTKHINNSQLYLFGIYFVQKLTKQVLISKYQASLQSYPYDFIMSLMNLEEKQIEIQKVVCNIQDPYSKKLISLPVRGSKCKHGQCFDLKIFISFMYLSKNRQWRCPVCNKQSKKLLMDKQMLQIIKNSVEQNVIPNQISFMKDGRIILRVSKDEKIQYQSSSQAIKAPKRERMSYYKRKKMQQRQQKLKQQK